MTDTTSTAPETDAEALNYDEVREYSVLETALMRRGFDVIKWLAVVVSAIAISLALFHLFIALFGTPESRAFRSTHLTGMMVLAVLLYPLGREKWSIRPTTPVQ